MKTYFRNQFLLPALIAGLGLIQAGLVTAQTFTTLHSFTAFDPSTGVNNDGAYPYAELILSTNTLYGTTADGGGSGYGTVFMVNTNGTGFTTLYSFTGGSDGAHPGGSGLILSDNTLYGTAENGGSSGNGTVFKVNTDGTGFTILYSFTARDPITGSNSDGAGPNGLILSGNTLYGTAADGGSSGAGTVFAINTDATGFATLHSFAPFDTGLRNNDGVFPVASLILSSNTLYGMAENGGRSGNGTVFKVNTDGTDFTVLHAFAATSGSHYTNSDGASPQAGLVLLANTLYGTAVGGGSSGAGTVFAINTDGTGFKTPYSFTAFDISIGTNSDGDAPNGLILSGNTLYGTARYGGSSGSGTVFKLDTDGPGLTTLHNFSAVSAEYTNSDGAHPFAGLILSGNTLYGTANEGGSWGYGALFSISLPATPPRLAVIRSASNVILTWPTNATGFTLQSTTNLVSPAVWTIVSPDPVIVNGNNTVTNPTSGTQQFYRLINNSAGGQ